jgi:hypothetical protein
MPPHVRSPMGRLNFFSGRRDSESSRQSELSRAFVSAWKAYEYGRSTHASRRAHGQNQYSGAGLRQSRRRHSSTRDLRNKLLKAEKFTCHDN